MDKHDAGLLERLRDEIVNEFDIPALSAAIGEG
jgi:hypothetical protein